MLMSKNSVAVIQLMAAIVAGAATAALIVASLQPTPLPPALQTDGPPSETPVSIEPFTDARTVSLELSTTETGKVMSPTAGVVTKLACVEGESLVSGTLPIELSGTGKLALHLSTPPWRDFNNDADGHDVAALQSELTRLGLAPGDSGAWDGDTRDAVIALQESVGADPIDNDLRLEDFVWLPAPSVVIDSCPVATGAHVEAGSEIILLRPDLVSAHISAMPTELVQGDRALSIGDLTMPVSTEGRISDPVLLATLEATSEASLSLRTLKTESPVPLQAVLTLTTPVDAAVIPARAIITTATVSCVVDAKTQTTVNANVLTSSLGQATIQFVDKVPQRIMSARPAGIAACA